VAKHIRTYSTDNDPYELGVFTGEESQPWDFFQKRPSEQDAHMNTFPDRAYAFYQVREILKDLKLDSPAKPMVVMAGPFVFREIVLKRNQELLNKLEYAWDLYGWKAGSMWFDRSH